MMIDLEKYNEQIKNEFLKTCFLRIGLVYLYKVYFQMEEIGNE